MKKTPCVVMCSALIILAFVFANGLDAATYTVLKPKPGAGSGSQPTQQSGQSQPSGSSYGVGQSSGTASGSSYNVGQSSGTASGGNVSPQGGSAFQQLQQLQQGGSFDGSTPTPTKP